MCYRNTAFLNWKYSQQVVWNCWMCHKPLVRAIATADHIIPKSKGGKATRGNLTIACQPCNLKRGNKDVSEVKPLLLKKKFGVKNQKIGRG